MRDDARMTTTPADPLTRVLRLGAPAALGYLLIATGIGHFWAGSWGSFAGIFGALIPTLFLGITAVTGLLTRRLKPDMLGFAILGSWLFKMMALLGFLAWFKHQDWYDRGYFFVVLLVGTFALLMLEGWLVTRSPQHYVTPQQR
jgi:hypothetical protein